uniref:Protein kinase (cAMP-dependent, catalytic) inhibitor gamma n=1 Tax=Cyprinus carpio carpio TaxID=630221 RepID=A0A9J7WV28_CYPCA
MMDVETSYTEFINCDRTGRRNAVPDIQGEAVAKGTSELTKDMAQMDLKAAEFSSSSCPLPFFIIFFCFSSSFLHLLLFLLVPPLFSSTFKYPLKHFVNNFIQDTAL